MRQFTKDHPLANGGNWTVYESFTGPKVYQARACDIYGRTVWQSRETNSLAVAIHAGRDYARTVKTFCHDAPVRQIYA